MNYRYRITATGNRFYAVLWAFSIEEAKSRYIRDFYPHLKRDDIETCVCLDN